MLDKVNQLQPRLFDWKEGARVGRLDTESYRLRDFGFIAQEMSPILPNMVSVGQDSEKLQGINYGKLTSVLVKAIQELNQRFSNPEQIKKFTILPRDLNIDEGELTPTLKIRRKQIRENWANEIESMYVDA